MKLQLQPTNTESALLRSRRKGRPGTPERGQDAGPGENHVRMPVASWQQLFSAPASAQSGAHTGFRRMSHSPVYAVLRELDLAEH